MGHNARTTQTGRPVDCRTKTRSCDLTCENICSGQTIGEFDEQHVPSLCDLGSKGYSQNRYKNNLEIN